MRLLLLACVACGDDREEATRALLRACAFFREHVATQGGYLWRYDEELKRREGERRASESTAWVQPPGTPTVGLAFLSAWEATKDRTCLEGAVHAARALVRGQLRSGGWTYMIEFDPGDRARHAYRIDPPRPKQRNWSTLDDNTTQSAALLLLRVDRALESKDAEIHEAAGLALEALLAAQFPHGGFPQGFQGPVEKRPVLKASYPDAWPRTPPPNHDYWTFPTLNDNLLPDLVPVLLEAARATGDRRFREAAVKAGDFLILAQMPDPQPAWAQQYDFKMQPTWARKFEPPAVTGHESQGAIEVLLALAAETGEKRFLEPVTRALDYLKRSRLPSGRLARFYELRTNTPLYFTKSYELTPSDADLPTHYGFKTEDRTAALEKAPAARGPAGAPSTRRIREVIAALDARGAWVEEGRLKSHGFQGRIISSLTFAENAELLSRFLAAK